MARTSLILVGIIFIFFRCNEPVKVTEVSETDVKVEYPCLTSSSDCLSEIDILGGTFQMYSSFHIDSASDARGAIIITHGNSRNAAVSYTHLTLPTKRIV